MRGILLFLWAACLIPATGRAEERWPFSLRGQVQEVTRYRAAAPASTAVVFLPGDGGWRGFAVDMARSLAGAGFDVYGWDVKRYLSGFTSARGPLREGEIQADLAAWAQALRQSGYRNVVLVGWSQGAAMAALAAAHPDVKRWVPGVVLLGLPERGVLGWRFADNFTYVTKAEPNEPMFATAPALPQIAPVRVAMIQSTADEYISLDTAKQLYQQLKDPKRFVPVEARNHKYEGNQTEFLRVLAAQVRWAESGA